MATAMYNTVQIASDDRMPIGMSRVGFLASCAAVETASNPMYAKNITPAPRRTPLQPNRPNSPVFGGTIGVRFARLTYAAPAPMNTSSTRTFTRTSAVFTSADSLIPITSRAATINTMTAAGRLNGPGGPASDAGTCRPTSRASDTK